VAARAGQRKETVLLEGKGIVAVLMCFSRAWALNRARRALNYLLINAGRSLPEPRYDIGFIVQCRKLTSVTQRKMAGRGRETGVTPLSASRQRRAIAP
jgi:hypothetical protein